MLILYKAISNLLIIFTPFWFLYRIYHGRESKTRWSEKLAYTTIPRPRGRLLWLHGASVGEIKSAFFILRYIKSIHPEINLLITSCTLDSAYIVEKELGDIAIHQYAPLDIHLVIKKFMRHWHPDEIIFVESELWPNMISSFRNIPSALLNARMSETSFKRWNRARGLVRYMLGCFSTIIAQSKIDQEHFSSLSGQQVECFGNIKYLSAIEPKGELLPPPAKPLILAASTHKGEEEFIIRLTKRLKELQKDVCIVIVPRHIERIEEIKALIEKHRLTSSKYLEKEADIYLVEQMGLLLKFYQIADISIIGGSLYPIGGGIGGHNPIEAACGNSAVITGNYHKNFQELYQDLIRANACYVIRDEKELESLVLFLLENPATREKYAHNLRELVSSRKENIQTQLEQFLQTFLTKKY